MAQARLGGKLIFTAKPRHRSLRLSSIAAPMRIFQLARKPPHWLRVALAGLLLAFALDSVAHAAHTHEATMVSVAHGACGYCAAFGSLGAAPVHIHSLPLAILTPIETFDPRDTFITRRPTFSTQPRAPPVY